MALVKLEIDGKRVIADSSQTILQVARQHGIDYDPDAVPRRAARAVRLLLPVRGEGEGGADARCPACSTKVTNGMVVETNTAEVRQSRKAALELLLSNHYADCVGPCQLACPAGVDIQGYIALAAHREVPGRDRAHQGDQPAAVGLRARLHPAVRGEGLPPQPARRGGRHRLHQALHRRPRSRTARDVSGRRRSRRPTARRVAVVGAGPGRALVRPTTWRIKGYDGRHLRGAARGRAACSATASPSTACPRTCSTSRSTRSSASASTLKTNAALGRDFTIASLKEDGLRRGLPRHRRVAQLADARPERGRGGRALGHRVPQELRPAQEDRHPRHGRRRRRRQHGHRLRAHGAAPRRRRRCRLLYRRTRTEMPANDAEIDDAIEEGVKMEFLVAPTQVVDRRGRPR